MRTSRNVSRVRAARTAMGGPARPTSGATMFSSSRLPHWLPTMVAATAVGIDWVLSQSLRFSRRTQLDRLRGTPCRSRPRGTTLRVSICLTSQQPAVGTHLPFSGSGSPGEPCRHRPCVQVRQVILADVFALVHVTQLYGGILPCSGGPPQDACPSHADEGQRRQPAKSAREHVRRLSRCRQKFADDAYARRPRRGRVGLPHIWAWEEEGAGEALSSGSAARLSTNGRPPKICSRRASSSVLMRQPSADILTSSSGV